VRAHDVDLVATPEIELTGGAEDGPVQFDATCEVRPVVAVAGYGGLRVELPSPEATPDEVAEAVLAERRRHGSLVDVDRSAERGDYVVLDLSATRDGDAVPGLNTEDWTYEIGRGWVAEGFDETLVGAESGSRLDATLVPSGTDEAADFTIEVQRVQALVLPEVTDEWVAENVAEHDTAAAWEAALAERIGTIKLNQARSQLVDRTMEALAALVEDEPPAAMVDNELKARVQSTIEQFSAQGIALDQWLAATGQDAASFVEGMRGQAERAVKVDLALRAVATAEGLDASDDDVEAEIQRIAVQVREKPTKVRRAYERNDALADLATSIRKGKAIDWLVHHVEIVDPEGHPIDRDAVLGHSDHDHDHDHGDPADEGHDDHDQGEAAE
jgi:trigger factor